MAEHQHRPVDESRQLRAEAAQTRLRAIRSQIAAGLTFCTVAESELEHGRAGHAHEMVEKLRKMTATIRRHLNEPNHVPSSEVDKMQTELEQLESRVLAVAEQQRRNC